MKRKLCLYVFILTLAGSLVSSSLSAELGFKWGPYLRLRHEYWKNISDMENNTLDNRNFFRTKASLWSEIDFDQDISLFVKLTNENRAYTYWGNSTTGKKSYHYDIHELVFDNFYLDFKNMLGAPLDLRLGRQDLSSTNYGEGFIFSDGTPRDGSRTYYFNAAKATWRISGKNTLEFFYIKNEKTDNFLPVINELDGEQQLNYSNEIGAGIYHKCDSLENLHWENYYIYKSDQGERPAPFTEKNKIHTLGSFAKYSLPPLTLRGQLSYQSGDYGDNDREGMGGYIFLDRDFKDLFWNPELSAGFYYLSGDDRNSSKFEGWNQLFSPYTWTSEIYCLHYSKETGTTYWTNLQMWRTYLILHPNEKTKLTFWYNFLKANEQVSAGSIFSGSGKNRGHLAQARLDHAFNKNISAYFLVEYFIPGNFYVDTADPALFLRTQLEFKF